MSGPTAPKRIPTDAEYAAFCDAWTEIARGDTPVTHDPLAILRAGAMRLTLRAAAVEAVERSKRAMRASGVRNSAANRHASVAKRNQGWRDAQASGKTPKQIYLDQPKGRGKKKLTLSTINRVLKAQKP
jgi:hypothetical protein